MCGRGARRRAFSNPERYWNGPAQPRVRLGTSSVTPRRTGRRGGAGLGKRGVVLARFPTAAPRRADRRVPSRRVDGRRMTARVGLSRATGSPPAREWQPEMRARDRIFFGPKFVKNFIKSKPGPEEGQIARSLGRTRQHASPRLLRRIRRASPDEQLLVRRQDAQLPAMAGRQKDS